MSSNDERTSSVVTPEQVRLQFHTAGIGSRAAAQLVDVLLLLLLNLTLFLLIGTILRVATEGIAGLLQEYAAAAGIVAFFAVNGCYFICTEYVMGGQTVGKRLLGLRVIQDNGQSLTFLAAVLRNLFRLIDLLPFFYFIGALTCFFNSRDKRVGDFVAGTVVVREEGRGVSRRRRNLDKALDRIVERELRLTGQPLPRIEGLGAWEEQFRREDWQLLSAYVERLPGLKEAKQRQLGEAIAARLESSPGLQLPQHQGGWGGPGPSPSPVLALIVLYRHLREMWEI